jgi:hypothetical protein
MAGADEQIDEWLAYMYRVFLQNVLIFWNWVTELWERIRRWCEITWGAILTAQKNDVYLFLDRNSLPFVLKEDSITEEYNNKLTYYPEVSTFFLHNRMTDIHINSFDCVDVSLQDDTRETNLTGFFMNIRWRREGAPSLVECVTLYSLLNNTPFSQARIADCTLVVLDSSANEHRIQLNSDLARRRFASWA